MSTSKLINKLIVCALLVAINFCIGPVQQLGSHNIQKLVKQSTWIFINFYSPTCQFCKKLTPQFTKLATKIFADQANIKFGKLDLINYKQYAKQYKVTSYPTLLLFNQNIDLPILYPGDRTAQDMEKWLRSILTYQLQTVQQSDINPIVYNGPKNQNYKIVKLLALRDKYKLYRWIENNSQQFVKVFNSTITQINPSLQIIIKKLSARIHDFGQQPWVNVYRKKSRGIIFINNQHNVQILLQLNKLAKKYYDIVFFQIQPGHGQYNQVLNYFSAADEPSIYAINPLTGGLHLLKPPLDTQNIQSFISKFLEDKLPQHTKTEHTVDPNILTAKNQNLLKEIKKDIVLILFDDTHKSTNSLLKLAKYMIRKLQKNEGIHIFICNAKKNDLKLEVSFEILPKVVFLRNGMKDQPIQFDNGVISYENLIEFIQQNTTFDWVQQQQL